MELVQSIRNAHAPVHLHGPDTIVVSQIVERLRFLSLYGVKPLKKVMREMFYCYALNTFYLRLYGISGGPNLKILSYKV